MSTATFLQIVVCFVVGWILSGFLFVAPDLIKSIRKSGMNRARVSRFPRK